MDANQGKSQPKQMTIAAFFGGGSSGPTNVAVDGESSGSKKRQYDRDSNRQLTVQHKRLFVFPWLVEEEDMLFCSLMKIIESVSNCLVDFKSNEIVTEISKTRHRQEFELKMSSQVERCAKWLLRATPSRISH